MMRLSARIRWLLLILVIGLAVLVVRSPDPASDQVLADGPPITDEVQLAEADTGPLVAPRPDP